MLPRAAQRRNVFYQLRQSTEQLTLPWLCPAIYRRHTRLNRPEYASNTSTASPSDHRRRHSAFQPARHLATATDVSPLSYSGPHVPFENLNYGASNSYDKSNSPVSVHSLYDDPAIIIQESQLVTLPSVKRSHGIGGSIEDMIAKFSVCIQCGDTSMAAQVLDRMVKYHKFDTQLFLKLHNNYLEAVVNEMISIRRSDEAMSKALALQTWFEVKLPRGTLKPDAKTMAIMLRMTLRMLHGSRRDRTIRRYWNMVAENGFELEVLSMDILSERDLGEISQLCPTELPRQELKDIPFPEYDDEIKDTSDSVSVRETKQKGMGLDSLKQTLSIFPAGAEPLDAEPLDPEEYKEKQRTRQINLEKRAVQSAKERWNREMEDMKAMGIDTSNGGKNISGIMEQWYKDLLAKIKQELSIVAEELKMSAKQIKDEFSKERRDYGIFLRCLEPETLAALTIMHTIHMFARAGIETGVKVPVIVTTLGQEIQNELIASKILQTAPDAGRLREALKKIFENRNKKAGRIGFKKLAKENELLDPSSHWPVEVHAKIGSALLQLLFDCAKVPVMQENPQTKKSVIIMEPAFQHSYEIARGRRFGVLHAHPEMSRRLMRETPHAMQARHMPMLSEPKPWTGFDQGGFLGHRSQIMRCTPGDRLQRAYIKKALENNGIPEIRRSLDILGKTAWTINNDVFDVMVEAWNTGEEFSKIPPLDPEFDLPPKPAEDDVVGKSKYNEKLREIENMRSGLHSQRCFMNFQMEISRAYRNETFYLPHNMDFRGRAYPLPAYLNQMSADNARSLLLFKKPKQLGESGLKWLKIHLSNVFGFDKGSFKEREQFAMDHLDDVLDSANNGLHGKRWFLKAEDPWQCLAACCELRNALRLEDPTQYKSRLPIHQDGSCNGLQHYAALGGDMEGAQHVNLEPGDRPKDIYTGVSDYVSEKVRRDAAAGNEFAQLLEGKIRRKIVKQTVMTNVYGVTFVGAVRQVRRQLVAHYPDMEQPRGLCTYVARAIFEALSSIFSGAHSIQYWLGDCATRICQSISPEQLDELANKALSGEQVLESSGVVDKDEMDPLKLFKATIIWTTPLGLPVVQPYRNVKCHRVYTTLQSLNIQQDTTGSGPVSKRKQLQAFPPNFIHSLDATHMMLSSLECDHRGLQFAAVHDSFWTHACDIDVMNGALRDSFIRMHSDNVIGRLAAEFRVRYDGYLFLAKIPARNKIAQTILQHRKKAGSNMLPELMLEYQRQTLLRSDDPVMQEKGRAMQTAASIFDSMGGTNDDLAVASTLGESGTGVIPSGQRSVASFGSSVVDEKDPAIASLFSDLDPQCLDHESDQTVQQELDEAEAESASDPLEKKLNKEMVWAWLPLTFRDIPKKGEFDVNRLRNSQYFFS